MVKKLKSLQSHYSTTHQRRIHMSESNLIMHYLIRGHYVVGIWPLMDNRDSQKNHLIPSLIWQIMKQKKYSAI